MFGINFNFAAQYNAAKNCGPFLPNRSGSKFSQMPELQKSMPTDSMQKKKTLFFFFLFFQLGWFRGVFGLLGVGGPRYPKAS